MHPIPEFFGSYPTFSYPLPLTPTVISSILYFYTDFPVSSIFTRN